MRSLPTKGKKTLDSPKKKKRGGAADEGTDWNVEPADSPKMMGWFYLCESAWEEGETARGTQLRGVEKYELPWCDYRLKRGEKVECRTPIILYLG